MVASEVLRSHPWSEHLSEIGEVEVAEEGRLSVVQQSVHRHQHGRVERAVERQAPAATGPHQSGRIVFGHPTAKHAATTLRVHRWPPCADGAETVADLVGQLAKEEACDTRTPLPARSGVREKVVLRRHQGKRRPELWRPSRFDRGAGGQQLADDVGA